MKRLPLICSVAAVAALSASLAYWGMQLFKPKQRPIAAVPTVQVPEANMDSARSLFGGAAAVAVVSNYQLRGVVADTHGRGSVAIISADGQPAKAYPVGAEVAAGVTVKEVQPQFVVLMEGGVQKRIELASDQGAAGAGGMVQGGMVQGGVMPGAPSDQPPPPIPLPAPAPAAQPMMPVAPPAAQPAPPPMQMAPAQPPTTSAQPSGGAPQAR